MIKTAVARQNEKVRGDQVEHHKDDCISDDPMPDQLGEEQLLKLVQSLPPQYKLVFNLYAIEGCSHKEISEALNISVNTSKSNLSRARSILKQKVTQLYEYKIIGDERSE